MINSNNGKTYNNFAEHPLAPLYFKYIDILIAKDLNQDVQRLLDIANSPLTDENIKVIAEIVASMEMLIKDDYNEFNELAELSDNLN
jgi:hypothetical protein